MCVLVLGQGGAEVPDPSAPLISEYILDGTLLCARWKANGDGAKENREWWEIESVENGVMKWKALRLRDDGTTYTANYELAKVK